MIHLTLLLLPARCASTCLSLSFSPSAVLLVGDSERTTRRGRCERTFGEVVIALGRPITRTRTPNALSRYQIRETERETHSPLRSFVSVVSTSRATGIPESGQNGGPPALPPEEIFDVPRACARSFSLLASDTIARRAR